MIALTCYQLATAAMFVNGAGSKQVGAVFGVSDEAVRAVCDPGPEPW